MPRAGVRWTGLVWRWSSRSRVARFGCYGNLYSHCSASPSPPTHPTALRTGGPTAGRNAQHYLVEACCPTSLLLLAHLIQVVTQLWRRPVLAVPRVVVTAPKRTSAMLQPAGHIPSTGALLLRSKDWTAAHFMNIQVRPPVSCSLLPLPTRHTPPTPRSCQSWSGMCGPELLCMVLLGVCNGCNRPCATVAACSAQREPSTAFRINSDAPQLCACGQAQTCTDLSLSATVCRSCNEEGHLQPDARALLSSEQYVEHFSA